MGADSDPSRREILRRILAVAERTENPMADPTQLDHAPDSTQLDPMFDPTQLDPAQDDPMQNEAFTDGECPCT